MENNLLLDAERFLSDIDSITLNQTSTNVSNVIKKLKLYDECCDQLLLSDEPNRAYIGMLCTGGLKNRSMMLSGTGVKAFVLLHASTNVICIDCILYRVLYTQYTGLNKRRNCDASEISTC